MPNKIKKFISDALKGPGSRLKKKGSFLKSAVATAKKKQKEKIMKEFSSKKKKKRKKKHKNAIKSMMDGDTAVVKKVALRRKYK